jgi:hypothetical protein
MGLGIVASFVGLGLFCWLLFTLAVYGLPFLAGMSAGLLAYDTGTGAIGAIAVGLVAGFATLIVGQFVFTTARSPTARTLVAATFVVPAAVAGYHAALGLAHLGAPSPSWQQVFAIVGAIAVGFTAWVRMPLHNIGTDGRIVAARPSLPPGLTNGSSGC